MFQLLDLFLFRRFHQRKLESVEGSLEAEKLAKLDLIKHKKQLETHVIELEVLLEESNRNKVENHKNLIALQEANECYKCQIEDEQKRGDQARETVLTVERRVNALLNELDDMRVLCDKSDKARRIAELDLNDLNERYSDLNSDYQIMLMQKSKLEKDLDSVQTDLDESFMELKNAEEMNKKVCEDAARLADELRKEQVNLRV